MDGVALERFHPESQGRHLLSEVTGREREERDKRSRLKGRIKGGRSRIVALASSCQIRIKEQCPYMMKDSVG